MQLVPGCPPPAGIKVALGQATRAVYMALVPLQTTRFGAAYSSSFGVNDSALVILLFGLQVHFPHQGVKVLRLGSVNDIPQR
jgi:hypothetical protein